jgi:hypothetical protein
MRHHHRPRRDVAADPATMLRTARFAAPVLLDCGHGAIQCQFSVVVVQSTMTGSTTGIFLDCS